MADLDRVVLHRVEDLERRHDLAGGEDADLELVVGRLRDALGHVLGAAVQRVEALRKARRQRQFSSGCDCAIAGAASAAAPASPRLPLAMNARRRIAASLAMPVFIQFVTARHT